MEYSARLPQGLLVMHSPTPSEHLETMTIHEPTLSSGCSRSRAPCPVIHKRAYLCSAEGDTGVFKNISALPLPLGRDPAIQSSPVGSHLNCPFGPEKESPSGNQNGIRRWREAHDLESQLPTWVDLGKHLSLHMRITTMSCMRIQWRHSMGCQGDI